MLPSVIGGLVVMVASLPSRFAIPRPTWFRASLVGRGWSEFSEGLASAQRSGSEVGGGGAEVAAALVAGFAFARAAGDFMAARSAVTGSGVMTVVGAMPESPDCMELGSFTAMRTGTLCG
jgi:hypothetical protein